jgi:hypothetical protein
MTGAVDAMPLRVTLIGALVLWPGFSRRLRDRRCDARELAARAGGAAAAALLVFPALASVAHGTFTMPASAMSGMRGDEGAGPPLAPAACWAACFGGGSAGQQPVMAYEVHVGSAALGAGLWVAVVLAVGCVISRRTRIPLGAAVDRLRPAWAPGVSAIVRMLLLVSTGTLVAVTFVGLVAGGRAATVAGGAILAAPNAVAVFLTLGLGSPWTASSGQVAGQGSNPLAALMGGMAVGAPMYRPTVPSVFGTCRRAAGRCGSGPSPWPHSCCWPARTRRHVPPTRPTPAPCTATAALSAHTSVSPSGSAPSPR